MHLKILSSDVASNICIMCQLLKVKQFDTWKGININGSLLSQYLVVEVKLTKYEITGNNLIIKIKIISITWLNTFTHFSVRMFMFADTEKLSKCSEL